MAQEFLKRFAWAEEKLKLKLKDSQLQTSEAASPIFCFETAIKLLYWCALVYEFGEVSALCCAVLWCAGLWSAGVQLFATQDCTECFMQCLMRLHAIFVVSGSFLLLQCSSDVCSPAKTSVALTSLAFVC